MSNISIIQKYWFFFALVMTAGLVLTDPTGILVSVGEWLKNHHGPKIVIGLIFFCSGLALESSRLKEGLTDWRPIILALFVNFIIAPVVAFFMMKIPMDQGVRFGLMITAAVPTTLISGVVMTTAAGGNMANALFISILGNSLGVVTVPATLTFLLAVQGQGLLSGIDQSRIIFTIAVYVLLPLAVGLFVKNKRESFFSAMGKPLMTLNQWLVVVIVWMALAQTRRALMAGAGEMPMIIAISVVFHGALLAAAFGVCRLFQVKDGARQSVIFMGGQKTLALSIVIQMLLFPSFGLALAVCVVHHIIHLMMDGYLVARIKTG